MKIEKKEINKTQVELLIELSIDELKPHLDQASLEISKEVKIPGFRAGKVPYDVLVKHVPETKIYEQAFYKAVNKTLPDAIKKHNIEFIGQPQVDAEKIAPGNPLVYKAVFALMPEVKLGDYKSFKAKKKEVKIDEEKVKRTFDDVRKMRASEKLVKREAKKGDKVVLDFTVKQNGVAIEGGQATKHPVTIGENQFIPGFEDEIVGAKAGEEKKFQLTFPEKYPQKSLAGKKCDFEVKIHEVYELTLPVLDDQFAQSLNFKTVDEFKKQITDNIMGEAEQKEKERLELALLEEIMERSEFDPLPPMLLDAEIEKMMHELKHQIKDSQGNFEEYLKSIKKTEKELREGWKPQAEMRLKTALITRKLAEVEKITASEEDVKKEMDKALDAYKTVPEMRKKLESPEYKQHLQNMLTNRKVFEFLSSFLK